MKKTEIRKKLLISSIAFAMVTTNTLFSLNSVHGEGNATALLNTATETRTSPVKAILTHQNKVMRRGENNEATTDEIANIDTVTDLLIDYQVTEIAENRFRGKSNITKLAFSGASADNDQASKVTKIGKNAFNSTGITSVELPKNLQTIDEGAFSGNSSLIKVDFKNSTNLETIAKWAFVNCRLTSLDLSPMNAGTQTALILGEGAFRKNTALTSVTLSTKITALLEGTFSLTKITAVEIPKGMATVHPATFRETPLANLTVNAENTAFEAEDNVLYDKGKTSLYLYPEGKTEDDFTIPNTVTAVKDYAFSSSPSLTKVVVGEALSNIGYYAFEKTAKLTTLDLRNAKAIVNITEKAFNNSVLSSMIISTETGPLNSIDTNAFDNTTQTRTVSFKNNDDTPIIGNELTTLVKKYAGLKETAKGSWKLESKFSTPKAIANYEKKQLTGLIPLATYTIEANEHITDEDGNIELLKEWSGKTISIVRKATDDQEVSDKQELSIGEIYSIYIDEIEKGWEIKGALVNITALEKTGHQFTTWGSIGITEPTINGNKISFAMPANDVRLTTQYTAITVETPATKLIFDGKRDVPVTIVSTSSNFDKLKVNTTELTKDKDYTVTGNEKTVITLKKEYLDLLKVKTSFEVSFKEGGNLTFDVDLYGPAPVAVANYQTMKLTELEANTKYKINETVMSSDAQGTIAIKRTWGGQTLEIIKAATDTETDSKPQNLVIKTFYTISVDGKELGYTADGMSVTLEAKSKEGYNFKEWTAVGVELTDATKEKMTFTMPASNVELMIVYTHIITSKPEEMIYNGKNEVIIRFDMAITEFQYIEYNGEKLVQDVDYIATSGSTIITFTKTFLDRMNKDMTGIKAVFTNNAAAFTIKHELLPPIQPAPPLVEPTKPTINPIPPVPAKLTIGQAKSPNTGDTTNMYLLFTMMVASGGALVVVNKKKQTKHKE